MSLDGSDNSPKAPGRIKNARANLDQQAGQQEQPPRQNDGRFSRRDERGGMSRREARGVNLDDVAGLIGGEQPPKKFRRETGDEDGDRDRRAGNHPARANGDGTKADPLRAAREDWGDDETEEFPASKAQKRKGKPLAEFAEAYGLKESDVYDLLIPSADPEQEPLTLSQIKDHLHEFQGVQKQRDEFEDYREEIMNEIFTSRQQIDYVLAGLKELVPPEQLASVFQEAVHRQDQALKAATRQIREWFPEWDDADRKESDKRKLRDHLGRYGFTPQEVDGIQDPRFIFYAMQSMRRLDRYNRLRSEGQREKQPTETPASRSQRRPDRKQEARNMADRGDIVGGVAKLIG